MKQSEPARLGISGFSGAGTTRLIEKLLTLLGKEGLRLAVLKHHNEPVQTDQPGSDTDRFYRAGATVLGYDGQAVFIKSHQREKLSVEQAIERLGRDYDLVLVEGFKDSDIDKIWLLREGETTPPKEVSNIIAVLPWSEDRPQQTLAVLRKWRQQQADSTQQGRSKAKDC